MFPNVLPAKPQLTSSLPTLRPVRFPTAQSVTRCFGWVTHSFSILLKVVTALARTLCHLVLVLRTLGLLLLLNVLALEVLVSTLAIRCPSG